MKYSIWSQGVQSDDYSVVIEDSQLLTRSDPKREVVLALHEYAKTHGKRISGKAGEVRLSRYKDYIVIEAVTDNTDHLGRRVPLSIVFDLPIQMNVVDEIRKTLSLNKLHVNAIERAELFEQIETYRRFKKGLHLSVALSLMAIIAATIIIMLIMKGVV